MASFAQQARLELSPGSLTPIVGYVCALGVGELAEAAAEITFDALRRQSISGLQSATQELETVSGYGGTGWRGGMGGGWTVSQEASDLAFESSLGLASLDRTVVRQHIARELEHGSSFSRWFLFQYPQLHDWQDDLNRLAPGLIAASSDPIDVVALQATTLLGTVTDRPKWLGNG